MSQEVRAHPLMTATLMKPFWFVLILPLVKGVVQVLANREISGVWGLEAVAFVPVFVTAWLRCRSCRLRCEDGFLIVKNGLFFRKVAIIPQNSLSSIRFFQNPFDAVFRAVTFELHTEAGPERRADFKGKLRCRDSEKLAHLLMGEKPRETVRVSAVRVALMSAATSSAVTGLLFAVPVIRRAGKLLGLAIDRLLLDELQTVSSRFHTLFPPFINFITLLFLLSQIVAFLLSFLKTVRFTLSHDEEILEVRSGFFVRRHAFFRKRAVCVVKIEQTPLMRLFRRFMMKVSVGGYGDARAETAVLLPFGRRGELRRAMRAFFPELVPRGVPLRAKRDRRTLYRSLFRPASGFFLLVSLSAVLSAFLPDMRPLIVFFTLIGTVLLAYQGFLSVTACKQAKVIFSHGLYAKNIVGFRTVEWFCRKENVGEIKLTRSPADRRHGTCSFSVTVRSQAADRLQVRFLTNSAARKHLSDFYSLPLSEMD
ncbi:MAG: PH domain-containing protein [Clostridia bacterium]|nr:PH domain-containing protein [Clostridia bacterium]